MGESKAEVIGDSLHSGLICTAEEGKSTIGHGDGGLNNGSVQKIVIIRKQFASEMLELGKTLSKEFSLTSLLVKV